MPPPRRLRGSQRGAPLVRPLLAAACVVVGPRARPLLAQAGADAGVGAVTGAVRDSASGRPLAGAAVQLRDSLDRTVGQAVTDERGRYRVAGSAAARRLHVVRIGFRPADVLVPSASAAPVEVALAAVPPLLAPVRVTAGPRCPKRSNTPAALGLLEQVRAGLLATVIAGEQQPHALTVLTYVREYAPDDAPDAPGVEDPLQIVRQTVRAQTSAAVAAPFGASRTGAEFVRDGFAADSAGQTKYFAPDPEALVDDGFAAGYCFRVVSSDQAGHVGLGFAPPRTREGRVDVDGVLWVDTVARSLRELTFRYVGLSPNVSALRPGGRVSFREMPTGVAYIDRWTLRLVSGRDVRDENAARRASGGSSAYGGTDYGVREDAPRLTVRDVGGELAQISWSDGRTWRAPLGAWRLHLTDQRGRPAAGASVRLARTDYAAAADSAGVVEFAGLLPGPYTASAVDPALEALGRGRAVEQRAVLARDSLVDSRLTLEMAERVAAVRGAPAASPRPGTGQAVAAEPADVRNDGKSIESLLTARFSGVEATRAEDGRLRIRIRGGSTSFVNGEDPLIVIDGVQLPQGTANLDFLDPDDVESVRVLKNAEDVGIYGLRGGNGVIVITTRRPPPTRKRP